MMIRSEQRVEFDGNLSLSEVEATAAQLDALGPAGKKALEVMRTLAKAIEGLENGTAHLRLVTSMLNGVPNVSLNLKSGSEKALAPSTDVLARYLSEFDLGMRFTEAFEAEGIRTVGDLIALTTNQLCGLCNSRPNMIRAVRYQILDPLRLRLKGEPPFPDANTEGIAPELLSRRIDTFNLSPRLQKAFNRRCIRTVEDLIQYTEAQLVAKCGLYRTSVKELREKILLPHNVKLLGDA
jgi:DNA-directed RNA polymerase alpha subunit